MPRKTIRRVTRKRFLRSKKRTVKSYIPVGLPNKMVTKMRYYSEFTLDPAVRPSVVAKEYRIGSLYDLDTSVGGQQPTPFDQMCAFYRKFRVLGAKCIMRNLTFSDTGQVLYGMIIQPSTGITSALQVPDIMQSERVTHNYKLAGNDTGNNRQSNNVLKMYYSSKKYFGKGAITDDDYLCSASADAVKYPILSCFASGTDPSGAVNPSAGYFGLWVEFIVLCTEPNVNIIS